MIKTKSREYIKKLHPSGWRYERAKRQMKRKEKARQNLLYKGRKAKIKKEVNYEGIKTKRNR